VFNVDVVKCLMLLMWYVITDISCGGVVSVVDGGVVNVVYVVRYD